MTPDEGDFQIILHSAEDKPPVSDIATIICKSLIFTTSPRRLPINITYIKHPRKVACQLSIFANTVPTQP
jgi:hypothetical protein